MPDPLIQDPASTQNFNRYSYCLNNPLKYTDESGEVVWLVPVIGAVIGAYIGYNSASKSNVTGWERIGYIAAGAAIGTVASLLASAVAAGITPIIAEAGIGGFAGGAITGSVSGLVGGGVSGFGYKLLDGGTLEDAFAAGGVGALSGAIAGGIMGGSAEGIKALKEGRNFWTGELPRPSNNYSSLRLKDDFRIRVMDSELQTPKSVYNYDLTPTSEGSNVTLYRGTTGTESSNGFLFMTDNAEYASSFIKNGGSLVEVTIPKETLEMMLYNGDLVKYNGIHMINQDLFIGVPYTEYQFAPNLKRAIVDLFKTSI